jgi:hypothetical protein
MPRSREKADRILWETGFGRCAGLTIHSDAGGLRDRDPSRHSSSWLLYFEQAKAGPFTAGQPTSEVAPLIQKFQRTQTRIWSGVSGKRV